MPLKGEHCAWMESSAVVYVNSVLGARTNVEGRESTGAAMLTGKIPYWGLHLDGEPARLRTWSTSTSPVVDQSRLGPARLLDRRAGAEEAIPVVDGITGTPDLVRLKHFGAAAASSGGVEMYHVPGSRRRPAPARRPSAGRTPVEHLRVRAARSGDGGLRAPQRHGLGHVGGPGDARLPARHPRPDPRRRPAARGPPRARRHRAVGLHPAGAAACRRAERVRASARGRRRAAHERHLPGDRPVPPRAPG